MPRPDVNASTYGPWATSHGSWSWWPPTWLRASSSNPERCSEANLAGRSGHLRRGAEMLARRDSGGSDTGGLPGGRRIAVERQREQRFLRDLPEHGAVPIDLQPGRASTPHRFHQGEHDIAGLLHVGGLPREGLPHLVDLGHKAPD